MKKRLCLLFLALLLLCPLFSSCAQEKDSGTVVVASKQFTENILLGEMYAQLIEHYTDLEVVRKLNQGNTAVNLAEIESAEIDIYVEYTGTILSEILEVEYDPDMSEDELYAIVKREMFDKKGITVYGTIGPNNKFALALMEAEAEALGVRTMSDLSSSASKLVFAASDMFFTRTNDGYDTMCVLYGYDFRSVARMDAPSMYETIGNDQVDAIIVYTTDSLLQKYDLRILDDDKNMFPDYFALPIIRNGALEKHPELDGILDMLAGSIDNERMQELNYMIDIENKSPEEVARQFLTGLGLLSS